MSLQNVLLAFVIGLVAIVAASEHALFNFTASASVKKWTEQSDTALSSAGLSKATIVIANNTSFRRAVFFALVNPQSDGAGMAGVRVLGTYNLTKYTDLEIKCRGQGNYTSYKAILRHNGENSDPYYTYQQIFTAPSNFSVVSLPLSDFKPYLRQTLVTNGTALNTGNITSIGLQMYAGKYETLKQSGPATLEIDWIAAV